MSSDTKEHLESVIYSALGHIAEAEDYAKEKLSHVAVAKIIADWIARSPSTKEQEQKHGMSEWKLVPAEPTEEMLAATKDDLSGIDSAVTIAAVHGFPLKWKDDKPPLYHAYKSMLAAAPPSPAPDSEAVWDEAIEEVAKAVEQHFTEIAMSSEGAISVIRDLKRKGEG